MQCITCCELPVVHHLRRITCCASLSEHHHSTHPPSSYLISLSCILFEKIAHIWYFSHFVFVCVFVFVFFFVFVFVFVTVKGNALSLKTYCNTEQVCLYTSLPSCKQFSPVFVFVFVFVCVFVFVIVIVITEASVDSMGHQLS